MRDKRQKFVELAERRVSKAVETIRLIGNLSNRNNYDYGEGEAAKILSALEAELRHLKGRFAAEIAKRKEPFKL